MRQHPELTEAWNQLARSAYRIDRFDMALGAYTYLIAKRPSEPTGYMGTAETFVKLKRLDDARIQATRAAKVAADRAARVTAHELLVRIALARRDAKAAHSEATLLHQLDPSVPMPVYVDARILYDQGRYADALPLFEEAIAELKKSSGLPMADLHYYTADTLERLARHEEAEAAFREQLRQFPGDTRALGGLAAIYHASGRPEAADQILADMIGARKDPDSYSIAAQLWQSFGNIRQAAAVRVEARKAFAAN